MEIGTDWEGEVSFQEKKKNPSVLVSFEEVIWIFMTLPHGLMVSGLLIVLYPFSL